ncbi:MAG: ABC-F family ATP-binding cassette domain-containing protein [Ruminococcaceae bacterium]|nr:ABC-F family ATP-binding cassette domain-containing protein [Oscillospiraceae bacterium]
MIINVNNVSHYFSDEPIVKDINLRVLERDKIGIIGNNGSGKTTFLKLLSGEISPSFGDISYKKDLKIGYQRQGIDVKDSNTVFSEMQSAIGVRNLIEKIHKLEENISAEEKVSDEYSMLIERFEALGGYDSEYQIKKVLNGMGFSADKYERKVKSLSGGEKTRLSLAKLLVTGADVLLLDEPTNHLDEITVEWLENFIMSYIGAVIIVTHDRWLLDRFAEKIYEVENTAISEYKGNYSSYLSQKELRTKSLKREYAKKLEMSGEYREYHRRNISRASTSKMAKSRLKMAEKINLDKPQITARENIRFSIQPEYTSNEKVIEIKGATIGYSDKKLIDKFDLTIRKGDRVTIVGPNGSGKTSLLLAITDKIPLLDGKIAIDERAKTSFLSQDVYGEKIISAVKYLEDKFPRLSILNIRNLLAALGFKGEDVFKPGSGLSGGELKRLNFARISLEKPNLLILDEPTNYLDMHTKEVLSNALKKYRGTLVLVSHDRHFVSNLDTSMVRILKDEVKIYDSYSEYRNDIEKELNSEEAINSPSKLRTGDARLNKREIRREKAIMREKKSKTLNRIEILENEISELNDNLLKPEITSDYTKLMEITIELNQKQEMLDYYIDEWTKIESDE